MDWRAAFQVRLASWPSFGWTSLQEASLLSSKLQSRGTLCIPQSKNKSRLYPTLAVLLRDDWSPEFEEHFFLLLWWCLEGLWVCEKGMCWFLNFVWLFTYFSYQLHWLLSAFIYQARFYLITKTQTSFLKWNEEKITLKIAWIHHSIGCFLFSILNGDSKLQHFWKFKK